VGPRDGLDVCEKSLPPPGFDPGPRHPLSTECIDKILDGFRQSLNVGD
jgi:hypothetical protein